MFSVDSVPEPNNHHNIRSILCLNHIAFQLAIQDHQNTHNQAITRHAPLVSHFMSLKVFDTVFRANTHAQTNIASHAAVFILGDTSGGNHKESIQSVIILGVKESNNHHPCVCLGLFCACSILLGCDCSMILCGSTGSSCHLSS